MTVTPSDVILRGAAGCGVGTGQSIRRFRLHTVNQNTGDHFDDDWFVEPGESITLFYREFTSGSSPPGPPHNIILAVLPMNSETELVILHHGAPPSNGQSFTFWATHNGLESGDPISGPLRLFVRASRTGLGNYVRNSDVGPDPHYQGVIKALYRMSEMAVVSPPDRDVEGIPFYVHGRTADELVRVEVEHTPPVLTSGWEVEARSLGFLHFTAVDEDFRHHTLNETPSDWTSRWASFEPRVVSAPWPEAIGGRVLADNNTTDALKVLTVDGVPPEATKVDLLALFRATSKTDHQGMIAISVSGGAGSEMALALRLDGDNFLRISRFSNGQHFNEGFAFFSWSANVSYWMRLRREGAIVRAKVWAAGNEEPAEWMITRTNLGSFPPGRVGVGTIAGSRSGTRYWDVVQVRVASDATWQNVPVEVDGVEEHEKPADYGFLKAPVGYNHAVGMSIAPYPPARIDWTDMQRRFSLPSASGHGAGIIVNGHRVIMPELYVVDPRVLLDVVVRGRAPRDDSRPEIAHFKTGEMSVHAWLRARNILGEGCGPQTDVARFALVDPSDTEEDSETRDLGSDGWVAAGDAYEQAARNPAGDWLLRAEYERGGTFEREDRPIRFDHGDGPRVVSVLSAPLARHGAFHDSWIRTALNQTDLGLKGGMLAHYPYDGDADDAHASHHGTLEGGAAFTALIRKLGSHSLFPGGGYAHHPITHPGIVGFMAWVRLDEHDQLRRTIVESVSGLSSPWRNVSLEVAEDDKLTLSYSPQGGGVASVKAADVFPLGVMVSVGVRRSGAHAALFQGGSLAAEAFDANNPLTGGTDQAYHVGANRDEIRTWPGWIDLPTWWSRELSEHDAAAYHNAGLGVPYQGMSTALLDVAPTSLNVEAHPLTGDPLGVSMSVFGAGLRRARWLPSERRVYEVAARAEILDYEVLASQRVDAGPAIPLHVHNSQWAPRVEFRDIDGLGFGVERVWPIAVKEDVAASDADGLRERPVVEPGMPEVLVDTRAEILLGELRGQNRAAAWEESSDSRRLERYDLVRLVDRGGAVYEVVSADIVRPGVRRVVARTGDAVRRAALARLHDRLRAVERWVR